MEYEYKYENLTERMVKVAEAESLGYRMLHDNFDMDWYNGIEAKIQEINALAEAQGKKGAIRSTAQLIRGRKLEPHGTMIFTDVMPGPIIREPSAFELLKAEVEDLKRRLP